MSNNQQQDEKFSEEDAPFALFDRWLAEAEMSEINDANAMALATVDEDGLPNVRMVLLKTRDDDGFVFYTNYGSQKGREILSSLKAALCFHWKSLHRQVRVRGLVEKVSSVEADAYYASRARGSQIGAWASQQSRPLSSRAALEQAVSDCTARFGTGPIARPPYWSGFRLAPLAIEFWHERPFRLHERLVFSRSDIACTTWQKTRLYP